MSKSFISFFVAVFNRLLQTTGINKAQISAITKIDPAKLTRIGKGEIECKPSEIIAIADAFGVPTGVFFPPISNRNTSDIPPPLANKIFQEGLTVLAIDVQKELNFLTALFCFSDNLRINVQKFVLNGSFSAHVNRGNAIFSDYTDIKTKTIEQGQAHTYSPNDDKHFLFAIKNTWLVCHLHGGSGVNVVSNFENLNPDIIL